MSIDDNVFSPLKQLQKMDEIQLFQDLPTISILSSGLVDQITNLNRPHMVPGP